MEGDGDASGPTEKKTICREFFDRFAKGKERCPEKLVAFLQNHLASRIRVDEWIQSAASDKERRAGQQQVSPPTPFSSAERVSTSPAVTSSSSTDADIETTHCSKRSDSSRRERELGNAYFKKKDLKNSLHHYNLAIKYACFPQPREGEGSGVSITDANTCLAIALANRSAVYTELGDPFSDKALQDADLAIKFGYPERLKSKLLFRKAAIYIKKCDAKKAKDCLDEINASVQSCEKDESSTKNVDIRNIFQKCQDLEMQIEGLQDKQMIETQDEGSGRSEMDENPSFENASNSVTIKISQELGRHVVALSDLDEGKLLFQEEPFASVLLTEFYDTHCHHCHVQLQEYEEELYFFPCKRCPDVLFCSYQCSEAAELYHSIECGWLDFLHSVGIAHLALRMILIAGVDGVLDCMKIHELSPVYTNLEIFKTGSNNYHRVYSLIDHIPDMFEEDLFQYTLTASLLTTFLITKTKFFSGGGYDERLKIGGTLLRHICQLICNAHAVSDILPDSGNDGSSLVIDESQKRVATAIYPAASMMNHSCDPNISFHFDAGKTLIVKTTRRIIKNENVYNCYGPQFSRMPRTERQEILLQQYLFNCNCDKCNHELKYGLSFADQFTAFKCQNCEGFWNSDLNLSCPHCEATLNLKISNEMHGIVCDLLNKGEYMLGKNEIDEAIKVFESCYLLAEKILFKYNSQLGQVCDSLARCYVMKGSPKDAQKYLEKSLQYVEARFGNASAEYSREFKKLEHLEKYS